MNIYLNGTLKEIENRDYTFEEIIIIVFGTFNNSLKAVTMISTEKDRGNAKSYNYNDKIKMKEGMRINADLTNNA